MQNLSVKAVAQLSGLTPHLLRAWERRYAVVTPSRSKNGRRLYSEGDIQKLKLLAVLTSQGHSIGSLANLNLARLQKLFHDTADSATFDLLTSLLQSVQAFDLENIDRQILRARTGTPVKNFVTEIAAPLLMQVGKLVEQRKLDIAQEHALSALMRTHLGELLAQVQRTVDWNATYAARLPTLSFSTPEGDLHEFGILLSAILAGTLGFRFRYLGPNMPAESLAYAADATAADIVVIGLVNADSKRLVMPLRDYIAKFVSAMQKKPKQPLAVWIGGHCDFNIAAEKSPLPIHHVNSFSDLESRLEKLKIQSQRTRVDL